jgi:hypothetical protein
MSDAESKVKAKLEWLRKLPLEGDGQLGLFARVHEDSLNALLDIAEAVAEEKEVEGYPCVSVDHHGHWGICNCHDKEKQEAKHRRIAALQALGDLPNE